MKNIKLYSEFINEELNILRGYTDDETNEEFDKLSPEEALQVSIDNSYLPGIKRAFERGIDINTKDENGDNILIRVSREGNLEVIKYLVELGANVNDKNEEGETALMKASQYGHFDIVKYLVENGANINIKDDNGYTAQIIATYFDYLDIASFLSKVDND